MSSVATATVAATNDADPPSTGLTATAVRKSYQNGEIDTLPTAKARRFIVFIA